jgi:stearoyl-CoA desaturase (delta-9 desaturase)
MGGFVQEHTSAPQKDIQKPKPKIDWTPTLFLTLTPIAAIVLTTWYLKTETFSWWMVTLFVAFYTATAMSITGGYHRLFAHKSYDASFIIRLLYALFGAAAFQNSILKWATDHRIHHRFVDSNDDPYSINKGFWYAHIGWMLLEEPKHPHWKSYQRDLTQDKIVMWQHKYYLPISIFMAFLLPGILGWALADSFLGGIAIGGCLRLVAVHHGTFLINSLSHWWGAQTYTDQNTARDNLFTAFLTFGEGYHNYHHLFANDYRNGIRWYHWDPTKWLIQFKAKLGLVYNLRKTPEVEILAAKLIMDEKRAEQRFQLKSASQEYREKFRKTMDEIRARLLVAQKRIQELNVEYRRIKAEKTENYRLRLEEIRREWRQAKEDWIAAYNEWKFHLNHPTLVYARS